MSYQKGQILTYHFPERTVRRLKKSNIIVEYHRIVVLHKRQTPYNTVLIAPITKASALKSKSQIPSNYVELSKSDYPHILEEDSFINLDMTMPVDEKELNKLEKYGKNLSGKLHEGDAYQLDYKITLTYELSKFIQNELSNELHKEFENVVEFIDIDIREKIREIVMKTNDITLVKDIIEVLDHLVLSIKKSYLKTTKKIS